ncbi:ABC transporter ATP-binding protein [Flexivirga sp. ID2601S]|uniref:ABC transporter ATP-binding protein n=1 Tax=Flexivirga aerilata TaxID=1656889 RepID=A0A849AGZ1_9MICO|nr:ABC transporter ATP-binding protein [Flexivirga aerilata]NNG39715.1 ABC transporter ATP-binding protein [Flexivirga aerilata]
MTTTTTTPTSSVGGTPPAAPTHDPARRVDWRRLKGPIALVALAAMALGAVAVVLGTVVAGRVAADPTTGLVVALAVCVVGGAVLDTIGRFLWAGVVDRAEGRLREDLLSAALHQPLDALTEQAVGEILDRVDDDTHELGSLLRQELWAAMRTVVALVPMWIVAGFTWWPAWLLFPLMASVTFLVVRPLLSEIARRKVIEEMAWTDHAAALEEGIAGADDLRTSLGASFAVRRVSELSAAIHEKFRLVVELERKLGLRAGVLLHAMLAAVGVAGVVLVTRDDLSIAALVTLFLVTTTFVGQIDQTARHLPEMQAGLGALMRVRQMMAVPPEPAGGADLPAGALDIRLADLQFSYAHGTFALRDIDLHVPAGQTIALVGRTGSGKSTITSLLSRAVEPEPGSVRLGGVDVTTVDLQQLRRAVGVVTQRTEILAGTLEQNITLFADRPRATVQAAVDELGLTDWVAGLPDGLDTLLGPGGTTLSAGEEQLVSFVRLLVRDVRVVVLDEATARMDPLTESRVVAAAERLLHGRSGVLVAHRLSTIDRADLVAVLDHGRLIQSGPRAALARQAGPFRSLLEAAGTGDSLEAQGDSDDAGSDESDESAEPVPHDAAAHDSTQQTVGALRRKGTPPVRDAVGDGPSLARSVAHALLIVPRWGLFSIGLFLGSALLGSLGAVTGFIWGRTVERLQDGASVTSLTIALVVSLILSPLMLAEAFRRYPRWWIETMLRTRMAVLVGQTRQRRLPRNPPGEVVARAMDADRFALYADRWVDFANGLAIAAVTALISGTALAGLILLAVMVAAAVASALGRPIAGRSAAKASAARAGFGRALVSALDSARTVKLAARTPEVHRHLRQVDAGRVQAAVFEHRVRAVLDGVPIVLVQVGVVAAWASYLGGVWGLATAILVANAVTGFDWFGRVAGAVVTEAPGTRAWQRVTSRFAAGADLMSLPDGVDLVTGDAPKPVTPPRNPLQELELRGVSALHDDGTIGVSDVDLTVHRGELVLLLGQVGSGKSSLLSALAGLLSYDGAVRWNGADVDDPQTFLRPSQVALVGQIPRVLSGTFADNVQLGHADRAFDEPVAAARLEPDIAEAGGPDGLVGHRGVRLSGGQVQRLALARALATDSELLLADDVSSALDAATEVELWQALRSRHTTVIGATSKRAALAQADRVVVLVDGRVAATGPWRELSRDWSHLAG